MNKPSLVMEVRQPQGKSLEVRLAVASLNDLIVTVSRICSLAAVVKPNELVMSWAGGDKFTFYNVDSNSLMVDQIDLIEGQYANVHVTCEQIEQELHGKKINEWVSSSRPIRFSPKDLLAEHEDRINNALRIFSLGVYEGDGKGAERLSHKYSQALSEWVAAKAEETADRVLLAALEVDDRADAIEFDLKHQVRQIVRSIGYV